MMCTDIIIRRLDFNKIHEASSTLAKCWKSAYAGLVSDEYLSSLKNTHWVDFLEKNKDGKIAECIVAEKNDKIVGVSIFGNSITEKFPDDGEIISLYVIPELIGQNIGHMLFEEAQQAIKKRGYRNCITCTFAENIRAVRFYKSHGYEIVSQDEIVKIGTQELPYVIMRKSL